MLKSKRRIEPEYACLIPVEEEEGPKSFTSSTIESLRVSILQEHILQVINTTFPLVRAGGTKEQIEDLCAAWLNAKFGLGGYTPFMAYSKSLNMKVVAIKNKCRETLTWWDRLYKELIRGPFENDEMYKRNCSIYISCCIVYTEPFWQSRASIFCSKNKDNLSALLDVIADVNIAYYDPECCGEVADEAGKLLDDCITPRGKALLSMVPVRHVPLWGGNLRITKGE